MQPKSSSAAALKRQVPFPACSSVLCGALRLTPNSIGADQRLNETVSLTRRNMSCVDAAGLTLNNHMCRGGAGNGSQQKCCSPSQIAVVGRIY